VTDRKARRRQFRQRLIPAFLLAMVLAYIRQLLSSPTVGQDFRAFFAAAVVLAHGGDPYNWASLGQVEDALYNAPGGIVPGDPAYYDFLPYPEGPWLAFALLPLAGWRWPPAYVLYAAVMGVMLAAGAWLLLDRLGWQGRRHRLVWLCVVLSPIAFINLFIGQVSPLIFLAFAGGWALAASGRAGLAGLLLTLIWVKPNIGLIIPAVVALLVPQRALRLLGGFAAGSAAAFGVGFLTLGLHLFGWPLEIIRFWRSVQGPQPDVASIHALYYPGLHGVIKPVALAIVLVAAATYAVWALRASPDAQTRGLTLLLVWLAGLPFVQSYDTILLLPILLVLLGPALAGWRSASLELAVWGFLVLPLAYFVGLRLGYFNGFTAVPVTLLALAWHRHRVMPRTRAEVVQAA